MKTTQLFRNTLALILLNCILASETSLADEAGEVLGKVMQQQTIDELKFRLQNQFGENIYDSAEITIIPERPATADDNETGLGELISDESFIKPDVSLAN